MNSNKYLAMGLLCFALCLPGSAIANDALLGQSPDGGLPDPELTAQPTEQRPGVHVAPNYSESNRLREIAALRRAQEAAAWERMNQALSQWSSAEERLAALLKELYRNRGVLSTLNTDLASQEAEATRQAGIEQYKDAQAQARLARAVKLETDFDELVKRRVSGGGPIITVDPGAAMAQTLRDRAETARQASVAAHAAYVAEMQKVEQTKTDIRIVSQYITSLEGYISEAEQLRMTAMADTSIARGEARDHNSAARDAAWDAWWKARGAEISAFLVDIEVQTKLFVLRNRPL